jgi:hypothetical protein
MESTETSSTPDFPERLENARNFTIRFTADGSPQVLEGSFVNWWHQNNVDSCIGLSPVDPPEEEEGGVHYLYDVVQILQSKHGFTTVSLGPWSFDDSGRLKSDVRCVVVAFQSSLYQDALDAQKKGQRPFASRFDPCDTDIRFYSLNPFHPNFVGTGQEAIHFLNQDLTASTEDLPWLSLSFLKVLNLASNPENLVICPCCSKVFYTLTCDQCHVEIDYKTFDFYAFFNLDYQVCHHQQVTRSISLEDVRMSYAFGEYLEDSLEDLEDLEDVEDLEEDVEDLEDVES